MIALFRKIRQSLLSENKVSKYLFYALGEIALVVIGILIALQINTWKEVQRAKQKEVALLTELRANLRINVKNLESDIITQRRSAGMIDEILAHADAKMTYFDSLPNYLAQASYAPDVILSVAAFETLKSGGLDLIQSDSLRREIVSLYEEEYPFLIQETRRLEDQLWPAVVIPQFQKHFRSKNGGWHPNDYENWLKDEEFFNMFSLRGELRKSSTLLKIRSKNRTELVIRLIDQNLQEGKE